MTPDHEAAKRYAAYIGDMARDHVCGQDDVNLSAAYLDREAQLAESRRFCRKCLTVRPVDEVCHSCFDKVGVLEAQCDEALALLERGVQLGKESCAIEGDEWGTFAENCRAFLAKHRKTGASK